MTKFYQFLHLNAIWDEEIDWSITQLASHSADFQQDSATTHAVKYSMHTMKNSRLRLISHDL
jgi:hypothetical protein